MTGIGNGRDHSTLHRLWADLETIGGQYENGFILEHELLERHLDLAASRLAEYRVRERERVEDWALIERNERSGR